MHSSTNVEKSLSEAKWAELAYKDRQNVPLDELF